jgi:hypothetical protein
MDDTTTKPASEQYSVRWFAEHYVALGFAVLPLHSVVNGYCTCGRRKHCGKQSGKHPRTRHGHDDATTDIKKIKLWKWETANIGIATGGVSNLLVMDIDSRNGGNETFDRLQAELGELPPCPVVATGGGGRHLYLRYPGVPLGDQKSAPGINIKTDGGLVVAPPSKHFSGSVYKWEVSPRKVPPPEMPAKWLAAFQVSGCYIDSKDHKDHEDGKDTKDIEGQGARGSLPATALSNNGFIARCIEATLPDRAGMRHIGVFKLAKLLQGNREMASLPVGQLRPVVDQWYRLAVARLGEDIIQANIDENWWDFSEGWDKVKYPGEGGLMVAILERARNNVPEVAQRYDSPQVRLLIAICRELQRVAGTESFFLPTSVVEKLLILEGGRMRASRWLSGLVRDGVLELVERGGPDGRRPNRYRYLGD